MIDVDTLLTQLVNGPAGGHAAWDQILIWVSSLGVPVLVALVALQWWKKENRTFVRHVLVAAGLSFLLGLGLNQLILLFVHRVRPYDAGVTHLLIPPSADWSLPSDHATASMAIAASFLLHRMPRTGVLFFSASLIMMYSRVYVGIHYAGDVLAGAVAGLAAAMFIRQVYRPGTRFDRWVTGIL